METFIKLKTSYCDTVKNYRLFKKFKQVENISNEFDHFTMILTCSFQS